MSLHIGIAEVRLRRHRLGRAMTAETLNVEEYLNAGSDWMESAELIIDLYGALASLRGQSLALWSSGEGGYWLVIEHAACREALMQPSVFSSRWGTLRRMDYPMSPDLPIHADPPNHARYRALLAPLLGAASPQAPVVGFELGRAAGRTLREARASGACFVELADKLAHDAFFAYLGLEEPVREVCEAGLRATRDGQGGQHDMYAETISMIIRTKQMAHLFDQYTIGGLEGVGPGAARLGVLKRELERNEFVGFMRLLYSAAVDTVAAQLALMVYYLCVAPELREPLIRDSALARSVVDELLRFDSPIAVVRQATRNCELQGVEITSGQMLLLCLNGANRDNKVFRDPDDVAIDRPGLRHSLTFGAGIHRCPGAAIGRELLAGALRGFLDVCPDFRIDPGSSPTWRLRPLRGLTSLRLRA